MAGIRIIGRNFRCTRKWERTDARFFGAPSSSTLFDGGKTFKWGVVLDGPQGANFWGIPTEVQDVNSAERYRQFRIQPTQRFRSNVITLRTVAAWEPTSTSPREASRQACALRPGLPTQSHRYKSSSAIPPGLHCERRHWYRSGPVRRDAVASARRRMGRHCACALRDIQGPPLHVSIAERPEQHCLSHRYFFPQSNWQGRQEPRRHSLAGDARDFWTDSSVAAWSSMPT